MPSPAKPRAVCATCQSTVGDNGRCLTCLLRGGLEEAPAQTEPTSPLYGDYEIARREDGSLWELGHGGMGVTYRAMDRVLQRAAALKVVQLDAATPATGDGPPGKVLRERFLREARAAAALHHPNVAGVFQFGVDPDSGRCYYAMELVEGETLEARVRREGPLDADTTITLNDGTSDLQRYLAGVSPLDPNAFPRITAFSTNGASVSVTFNGSPSRLYTIETTTDLTGAAGAWGDAGLGLFAPDGSTTTRTLPQDAATRRFYRVRAQRPIP